MNGFGMNENVLLFRVVTPDGHEYKCFLNGRTEGFPNNSIIENNSTLVLCDLSKLLLSQERIRKDNDHCQQ